MNTIGIVSRIENGKGQDILIDAVYILKKRVKNVKALIVGEGDDSKLKARIEKLDLNNNIELLGFQKDLKKYFSKMDVFVFPTYWPLEGFGLVLLEAMKAGIPIVTTNFGPVPEIVNDVAILVKPKDEKSLAEAIHNVLTDRKLAHDMVLKGSRRIKQFDIRKIADLYLNNFLEVVKANA